MRFAGVELLKKKRVLYNKRLISLKEFMTVEQKHPYNKLYVISISLVAAMGGLMFGFDLV